MSKEYTYIRLRNNKVFDEIKELSFDAAQHLARVNSSVTGDTCHIYSKADNQDSRGKLIEIIQYKDGKKTNTWITDEDSE